MSNKDMRLAWATVGLVIIACVCHLCGDGYDGRILIVLACLIWFYLLFSYLWKRKHMH